MKHVYICQKLILCSFVNRVFLFIRYKATEQNKNKRHKWQIFFKIFCFIHPERVLANTVEGIFLFEQVNNLILHYKIR